MAVKASEAGEVVPGQKLTHRAVFDVSLIWPKSLVTLEFQRLASTRLITFARHDLCIWEGMTVGRQTIRPCLDPLHRDIPVATPALLLRTAVRVGRFMMILLL
jgi:hypothetical protein